MIRRSILYVLLYRPRSVGGRTCDPELFLVYFYEAVGQAAVRPELPLYPDHVVVRPPHCPDRVVVDRPHYPGEVWAPAPLHRTKVATFALGNSWLGV